MVDVFYPHKCVIKRTTGEVDLETYEEVFTELYSGKCGLQYGSGGNTSFQGYSYQASPALIIPATTIPFAINDAVVVSLENGREVSYTVEQIEVCTYAPLEGTTLWLKDGAES